jgi:hypothetical protein
MDGSSRRRAIVFAIPLIIALVASQRIAASMRTVDFLQVFASGALFGVGLTGLIQVLRGRGGSTP